MVIVVVAPVRIESPGLQDGIEDLPSKELVASVAVEALHEGVLPGRPRIDVGGSGAGETTPVADGQGDELRPVIAADEPGAPRSATAGSSTWMTWSAVRERATALPTLSRVYPSHIAKALK